MNKKRFLVFTLMVLSAGVALRLTIDRLTAQGTSNRVPFTMTQVYTVSRPSGNWPTRRQEIMLAVKGDGSLVQRTKIFSDAGTIRVDRREVYDLSTGRITAIDPFTQSKTTGVLTEAIRGSLTTQIDTTCEAQLGPNATVERNGSIMSGYRVVRTTENSVLPDGGKATTVEWRAPELNYFPLRKKVTFVSPKGNTTVNLREVQTVVTGEPASELFDVPANYAERSPSEVVSETARLKGIPCSDCGQEFVGRADQKYQQNRPLHSPVETNTK